MKTKSKYAFFASSSSVNAGWDSFLYGRWLNLLHAKLKAETNASNRVDVVGDGEFPTYITIKRISEAK